MSIGATLRATNRRLPSKKLNVGPKAASCLRARCSPVCSPGAKLGLSGNMRSRGQADLDGPAERIIEPYDRQIKAACPDCPMTLANMRSLGVRSVVASCTCGRESSVNVDRLPDTATVPSIRLKLRCSACGARPDQTRPDWLQYNAKGSAKSRAPRRSATCPMGCPIDATGLSRGVHAGV